MKLTSAKTFSCLAALGLLSLAQTSCSTTSFGGGGTSEGDHMIKRGQQLVSMGEKQQKQGAANISRGQDMIQQGNQMKSQGGGSHQPAATYHPDRSNY